MSSVHGQLYMYSLACSLEFYLSQSLARSVLSGLLVLLHYITCGTGHASGFNAHMHADAYTQNSITFSHNDWSN